MSDQPLRVCYFGAYRADYSRNRIMIEGLRRNGVTVFECHEQLWRNIEDRVQVASGGWRQPHFWWRVVYAYGRLLRRYFFQIPDHDVVIVGYPGQLDVFPARLLSWLRRKPLIWDIFMSIYLIAVERGLDQRSQLSINLLRWLEWTAIRLPDRLVIDTAAYAAWFQATHHVSTDRFRLVPTGADDRVFRPMFDESPNHNIFCVIYYGSFIPNHGVLYIVEAARLLAADPTIHFEFIGDGPDKAQALSLAREYALSKVTFSGWLDQVELVRHVARSAVCLGAFGMTPQSLMTIQNKIYEGLAMAKPVITGDSSSVREVFKHGEHLYLCKRADPQSLAEAIRVLRGNIELRRKLSRRGLAYYQQLFTPGQIGLKFKRHLNELA